MPSISLVIPTYKGRAYLGPCLESVRAQTLLPDEIIVVDDGTPDPSDAAFVEAHYENEPRIKSIRTPINAGFAGAVNRGIRAASGQFIALINNDTVLDKDWLKKAMKPFFRQGQGERVGAVATRIVHFNAPDLIDSAGDLYTVAGGSEKGHHARPTWAVGAQRETFSACAAAAVYRREALDAVRLPASTEDAPHMVFDPAFGSYYEDVDLGFRLQLAGWKCIFTPEAVCLHHVSASYGSSSWTYHFRSSRNAEIVFWSNMPAALLLRYLPSHLCFLIFQAAFKACQGRFLAWAAGKLAFLWSIPGVRSRRAAIQDLRGIACSDLANVMQRHWFGQHWAVAQERFCSLRRTP